MHFCGRDQRERERERESERGRGRRGNERQREYSYAWFSSAVFTAPFTAERAIRDARQYLLARVLFDESVLIKRGINRVRAADADCGLMNIVNKVERCLTVAQLFKQRSARVQRGGGGGGGKGNRDTGG